MNPVLDTMQRLAVAQLPLLPVVLFGMLTLRLLPLRASTRALGAAALSFCFLLPLLVPVVRDPGPLLDALRVDRTTAADERAALAGEAGTAAAALPWSHLLWLTGTVVLLVRGLLAYTAARHRLLGLPRAPQHLTDRVRRLAADWGMQRALDVRLDPRPSSPSLYCLPAPTVVLPDGLWNRLDRDTQDAMLRHELAHLRRGDPWLRLLAWVTCTLLWWHPCSWGLRSTLRREGEEAADAWAVESRPEAREPLAQGLLQVQRSLADRTPPPHPGLAVLSRSGRQLQARLRRLFADPRPRTSLPGHLLWLLFGLAGTFGAWVGVQSTGAPTSVRALATLSEDLPYGQAFARALIRWEGETRLEDLPRYRELLRTATDAEVRRCAADDLGNLFRAGAPGIPDLLHALAHDPSVSVRREAADALGRIGAHGIPEVRAELLRLQAAEPTARVRRQIDDVMQRDS